MRQADIFLEGEGDAWLERNRDNLGKRDPVYEEIVRNHVKPTVALEVGCSNGWRLAGLRARYGCAVFGVEPSRKAGVEAADHRVPVIQSTASDLAVEAQRFDLVIYGFCLYLTEPNEWLRIAAEGDRALRAGGHLIIHDFKADEEDDAFARHYRHHKEVMAYHFDFANLWLGCSQYRQVSRRVFGDEMVTILKKVTTLMVRP